MAVADRLSAQMKLRSGSEAQTAAIGEAIGGRIDGGMCICVTGSLGSGKSVLVRGICKGLGVDESVISPSFILCEEYQGRLPVIHSDLYRLEHESEIEALGLFDRLDGATVVVVEWGDRSERMMREADMTVHISLAGEARSLHVRHRPENARLVEDL